MSTTNWVRVMADHCATGLWDFDGCPIEPSQVPCSEGLTARIAAWCHRYSLCDESWRSESERRGTFDLKEFTETGLALSKALKGELPAWTVVYFDEHAAHLHGSKPGRPYEYEVAL